MRPSKESEGIRIKKPKCPKSCEINPDKMRIVEHHRFHHGVEFIKGGTYACEGCGLKAKAGYKEEWRPEHTYGPYTPAEAVNLVTVEEGKEEILCNACTRKRGGRKGYGYYDGATPIYMIGEEDLGGPK